MTKPVMVVEDDPDIRASVVDLLSSEGYAVTSAVNGAEALAKLRGGERPRVIMLDLMMPEVDGYQFRAEQRRDPALAAIPVLIMSAGTDIAAKAKELGVSGFLKKPFADLDTILATIAGFF